MSRPYLRIRDIFIPMVRSLLRTVQLLNLIISTSGDPTKMYNIHIYINENCKICSFH